MRVIAINGSPKANGNCAGLLKIMEKEFVGHNIDFETVHLGGKIIRGCIACNYCQMPENSECVFKEDVVNETAKKMRLADGIILASPTYYGGIAGTMKSFLDRAFFSSFGMFKNKVGASFTTLRRSGGISTFQQLNNYLQLGEFVVAQSQYWLAVHGLDKGEFAGDAEGIQSVQKAAQSMVWLLKTLDKGKDKNPPPLDESRKMTNFIR